MYTSTKTHGIVHFKWVHFILYKLHLKVVFKNKIMNARHLSGS